MNKITITNNLSVVSGSSPNNGINLIKQTIPTRTSYSVNDSDFISLVEQAFPNWRTDFQNEGYSGSLQDFIDEKINEFSGELDKLVVKIVEYDKLNTDFISFNGMTNEEIQVFSMLLANGVTGDTTIKLQRPIEDVRMVINNIYNYIDSTNSNNKEGLKAFVDYYYSNSFYKKSGELTTYGRFKTYTNNENIYQKNIIDILFFAAIIDFCKANDFYRDSINLLDIAGFIGGDNLNVQINKDSMDASLRLIRNKGLIAISDDIINHIIDMVPLMGIITYPSDYNPDFNNPDAEINLPELYYVGFATTLL